MSSRSYPRLGLEEFGEHLVKTKDLDPVYLALNGSGFDGDQKKRWLLAYIGFYHCGFASWASEFEGWRFWDALLGAGSNETAAPTGGRWPRGRERRHFRGKAATGAIKTWRSRYGERPEGFFEYIAGAGGSVRSVIERALEQSGVGSWSAFKCADLVDACLGFDLDQAGHLNVFLYETPRRALLRYWEEWKESVPGDAAEEEEALLAVLLRLSARWSGLNIPHKPGKKLDYFCLETCACKWGSHLSGHYPLGNDIREISETLWTWAAVSPSAEQFLEAMPKLDV